eukprot:Rhum_TRINITY_DN15431_c4_g1::Rhum_TRINITY_DN15431_c4_g1_i17::g.157099::m.157099
MTPVAVGWAGKKGDGCNYCYCAGDMMLRCSARPCPTPPGPPPPLSCSSYTCFRDVALPDIQSPVDKADKAGIVCADTGCSLAQCCDWADGRLLSPEDGAVDFPRDALPEPQKPSKPFYLWLFDCDGLAPLLNIDLFNPFGDSEAKIHELNPFGRKVELEDAVTDVEFHGARGAFVILTLNDISDDASLRLRHSCVDADPPPPPLCGSYACSRTFPGSLVALPPPGPIHSPTQRAADTVCSAGGCSFDQCCEWADGALLPLGGPPVRFPGPFERFSLISYLFMVDCGERVPRVTLTRHDFFTLRFTELVSSLRFQDVEGRGTNVVFTGARGASVLLELADFTSDGTFTVQYECID